MSKQATMPLSDYQNACNIIREKTGTTDLIKSGELSQQINTVFEKSKQAQYDEFWDAYQDNGNRTNYEGAFYGFGWNEKTFNPKYDMKPVYSRDMFRSFSWSGDLVELLKSKDIILDFSDCVSIYYTFYSCAASRLGVIDCRKAGAITSAFAYCAAIIIDKIITAENVTYDANAFRCSYLEEIRFEGEIGQNINFSQAPNLSYASLISIIDALKDYSASSETHTVTLGGTNLAKLTDAEKLMATNKGWTLQ